MISFIYNTAGAAALAALLLSLVALLKKASARDFNQSSPFECGFDKPAQSLSFSLRYFMIALLFLLFDLEILLIFPSVLAPNAGALFAGLLIIFLGLGLFWEWNQSLISWSQ